MRITRRTYSRFLPVEVTVWGASVTTVSPSSPNLEGVLILLSALFVKRSSVDSLLLPRNRFPRSIVTYCKFRTLLCDQLYKAWEVYESFEETGATKIINIQPSIENEQAIVASANNESNNIHNIWIHFRHTLELRSNYNLD